MLKKIISPFLIIAFSGFLGYGQDTTQHQNKITSVKNRNAQIDDLYSLLSQTMHPDSTAFIEYSKQYIALTIELDSIDHAAKKTIERQRRRLWLCRKIPRLKIIGTENTFGTHQISERSNETSMINFLNSQRNVYYGCSILVLSAVEVCPLKNKYYRQMKITSRKNALAT